MVEPNIKLEQLNNDEYNAVKICASLFNVSVEELWENIQNTDIYEWINYKIEFIPTKDYEYVIQTNNGEPIWEFSIYMDPVDDMHLSKTIYGKNHCPNPQIIYVDTDNMNNDREGYIAFDTNMFIEWLGYLYDEGDLIVRANNFEKIITAETFRAMFIKLDKTKDINDFLKPLGLKEYEFYEFDERDEI